MASEKVVNGVNVGQLFTFIEQVKGNPAIGQFKFRAKNRWQEGTHSRATVKDFYGALKEDDTREARMFDLDEPPILCGHNKGTNPVEYLLVALSGCLTTSMVAHAAARGIELKKVESRYEGEIDLRGFLGISEDVPVNYKSISVFFKIDADISEEKKEELVRMAQKYSPVFNTITKAIPVKVQQDEQ
jgi:uncharacterized OsmC-like protein